jgi:A/G-specific adenine glycosylase
LNWLSGSNENITAFARALEGWYDHHQRDLPWRKTSDPYCIYLSEIILQQTRVTQGLPYYLRFVAAYPTVTDLARADERDLLRLWQGLGYYARARNLHQTARHITYQLNGQFPATYAALLQLKGIGTYTAAAIASFAFGERVPVVDGNVYRVLARVFGITEDITTTPAKKTFAALAVQLMAHADDPATYNQAIMEFGAIQCTPVSPDCLLCPVQSGCVAYQTGRQHQLPVKAKKAAVKERFFSYLILRRTGPDGKPQVAMKERCKKDIWQNLFEFPLIETDEPIAALRELPLPNELARLTASGTVIAGPEPGVQLLTHQRVRAVFWRVDLPVDALGQLPDGVSWVTATEAEQLPKPVLITNSLAWAFA